MSYCLKGGMSIKPEKSKSVKAEEIQYFLPKEKLIVEIQMLQFLFFLGTHIVSNITEMKPIGHILNNYELQIQSLSHLTFLYYTSLIFVLVDKTIIKLKYKCVGIRIIIFQTVFLSECHLNSFSNSSLLQHFASNISCDSGNFPQPISSHPILG